MVNMQNMIIIFGGFMERSFKFKCMFLFFLFLNIIYLSAQTGKISGKVTDKKGNPLPGANVLVQEENIGTATNMEGEYTITKVPVGKQNIVVSYIGYQRKVVSVEVGRDKIIVKNISLEHKSLRGEEVEIKVQAIGQNQAISEQMGSNTIKNIVSSQQIQSLPEANAAEAVGRLPGVSLQRAGGEGSKVVIRGLSSDYTKVQIDGVSMSSTSGSDRSVDLSMISQYMLSGIELTKSISADQEASATGGIVNFRIKEAPSEPSLNVLAQGGYNGLSDSYGNYKFSLGGSNRFFDDKLGVYAQVDIEEKDASSDEMYVDYSQPNIDRSPQTNSVYLSDINRGINRYGGSLVIDYKTPATKIKLANFASRIKRERQEYRHNVVERNYNISVLDNTTDLDVMTNSLKLERYFGDLKINSSVNYSYSKNTIPGEFELGAYSAKPVVNSSDDLFGIRPFALLDTAKATRTTKKKYVYSNRTESPNIMERHLGTLTHREFDTEESEISASLDFEYEDLLSNDLLNFNLKWGGKYKYKDREFDQDEYYSNMSGQYQRAGELRRRKAYFNLLDDNINYNGEPTRIWSKENMEYLAQGAGSSYILAYDLYDKNYRNEEFLRGKYTMSPGFDIDKIRKIDNHFMMDVENKNFGDSLYFQSDTATSYNVHNGNSKVYDYKGNEKYWAAYLMPSFSLGDLNFTPGVRYEKMETEYTGYRTSREGVQYAFEYTEINDSTTYRDNEYFLPMIHLTYKPVDWFKLKGGYTKTLKRPNYSNVIPNWSIGRQGNFIDFNNFQLKPEKAYNYDLNLSILSDKVGLLSLGGFYKRIEDMIFQTGVRAITYDEIPYYKKIGLTKEFNSNIAGKKIQYYKNNENTAYNYGFEVQYNSNFWYLPGALSGLVLNVNYTRNWSEGKYFQNNINSRYDPVEDSLYVKNNETTYKARLIDQPKHLFNITVGWDYKDFSIKIPFRYKSNIFSEVNQKKSIRVFSEPFIRLDLTVNQKLPVEGVEMFLNVNNVLNNYEQNIINYKSYTANEMHYGRTADLGVRYKF